MQVLNDMVSLKQRYEQRKLSQIPFSQLEPPRKTEPLSFAVSIRRHYINLSPRNATSCTATSTEQSPYHALDGGVGVDGGRDKVRRNCLSAPISGHLRQRQGR